MDLNIFCNIIKDNERGFLFEIFFSQQNRPKNTEMIAKNQKLYHYEQQYRYDTNEYVF
jgi:hypothetical protein